MIRIIKLPLGFRQSREKHTNSGSHTPIVAIFANSSSRCRHSSGLDTRRMRNAMFDARISITHTHARARYARCVCVCIYVKAFLPDPYHMPHRAEYRPSLRSTSTFLFLPRERDERGARSEVCACACTIRHFCRRCCASHVRAYVCPEDGCDAVQLFAVRAPRDHAEQRVTAQGKTRISRGSFPYVLLRFMFCPFNGRHGRWS